MAYGLWSMITLFKVIISLTVKNDFFLDHVTLRSNIDSTHGIS